MEGSQGKHLESQVVYGRWSQAGQEAAVEEGSVEEQAGKGCRPPPSSPSPPTSRTAGLVLTFGNVGLDLTDPCCLGMHLGVGRGQCGQASALSWDPRICSGL